VKISNFRDYRAYTMTFWALFIGLVIAPLMALSIEIARFFTARAQISAAADAAALAAAVELDSGLYQDTGILALSPGGSNAWANRIIQSNCAPLIAQGIRPGISAIHISGSSIEVSVSANLERLFPTIIPDIRVTETGKAEVRVIHP
jgi:hypothetical protein